MVNVFFKDPEQSLAESTIPGSFRRTTAFCAHTVGILSVPHLQKASSAIYKVDIEQTKMQISDFVKDFPLSQGLEVKYSSKLGNANDHIWTLVTTKLNLLNKEGLQQLASFLKENPKDQFNWTPAGRVAAYQIMVKIKKIFESLKERRIEFPESYDKLLTDNPLKLLEECKESFSKNEENINKFWGEVFEELNLRRKGFEKIKKDLDNLLELGLLTSYDVYHRALEKKNSAMAEYALSHTLSEAGGFSEMIEGQPLKYAELAFEYKKDAKDLLATLLKRIYKKETLENLYLELDSEKSSSKSVIDERKTLITTHVKLRYEHLFGVELNKSVIPKKIQIKFFVNPEKGSENAFHPAIARYFIAFFANPLNILKVPHWHNKSICKTDLMIYCQDLEYSKLQIEIGKRFGTRNQRNEKAEKEVEEKLSTLTQDDLAKLAIFLEEGDKTNFKKWDQPARIAASLIVERIQKAFETVLPIYSKDLLSIVFKDNLPTKEQIRQSPMTVLENFQKNLFQFSSLKKECHCGGSARNLVKGLAHSTKIRLEHAEILMSLGAFSAYDLYTMALSENNPDFVTFALNCLFSDLGNFSSMLKNEPLEYLKIGFKIDGEEKINKCLSSLLKRVYDKETLGKMYIGTLEHTSRGKPNDIPDGVYYLRLISDDQWLRMREAVKERYRDLFKRDLDSSMIK